MDLRRVSIALFCLLCHSMGAYQQEGFREPGFYHPDLRYSSSASRNGRRIPVSVSRATRRRHPAEPGASTVRPGRRPATTAPVTSTERPGRRLPTSASVTKVNQTAMSQIRRVPIGALFGGNSEKIRSAFTYELLDANAAEDVHVKLDANSQQTKIEDSYSVATTLCSQLSNGIMSMFGMHDMRALNIIRSITSAMNIPYVTTSMAVERLGLGDDFMVYMQPYYVHAILGLIKHYRWNKVYYVYDSEDGLHRLQHLFDALLWSSLKVDVKVIEVPSDVTEIYHLLAGLDQQYGRGDKPTLLDLPYNVIEELLRRQKWDIWRVNFHYVPLGLGILEMDLSTYSNGGLNITGLQMVDFDNHTQRLFLDRWASLNPRQWAGAGENNISFEAALAIDAVRLIGKAIRRLFSEQPKMYRHTLRDGQFFNNGSEGLDCEAEPVAPWFYGKDVLKAIRNTEMDGLTGPIAFDSKGLRTRYSLDVYEISVAHRIELVARYTPEIGLSTQILHTNRDKWAEPISQEVRIVTSILTKPYLMRSNFSESGEPLVGNDKFTGYCKDLAVQVAESVGFEFIIQPVRDEQYGSELDNGTWNGMIGEVIRGEADIAIAPLTITASRERVMAFSKPFMNLGISIMIKKSAEETPGVFSFLYPLSHEIWTCVIFGYIGVSVVLFLVSRFSPLEWEVEDGTDGPSLSNSFSILNSLWFSLGAFMQQGCDFEPKSVSGRIVGSVWWFFTLILISSYTANLAAFLTATRMQNPIKSADDLAKQTKVQYGTVQGGSTMAFFQSTSSPLYERMWLYMSSADPPLFMSSNEEGVQRVRESGGLYAFLIESTTNDYINERKPCDTEKVGSNLDAKGYGVGTRLGSDLRDRISLSVLKLREVGDLRKLEKKWWFENSECGAHDDEKKDATAALQLQNVAGIFFILVGGTLMAMVVAALEFLYKSQKEAHGTSDSSSSRNKSSNSMQSMSIACSRSSCSASSSSSSTAREAA